MQFSSIDEYLQKLVECKDEALLFRDYGMSNNYDILLFGDQESIFSNLINNFYRDIKNKFRWKFLGFDRNGDTETYKARNGTIVSITKVYNSHYVHPEDRPLGMQESIWILIHPNYKKKGWYKEINDVIFELGQYIIQQRITSRFHKIGLNYVPEK